MRPVNFFAANQIVDKEKRKAQLLKLCAEKDMGYQELADALQLNLSVIPNYCSELFKGGWIAKYRLKTQDTYVHTYVRTIKFEEYPIPEYKFEHKPRNRVHPPIELPFDRKLSAMMGYTDIQPEKGNQPKESVLEQIYHATEFMRKMVSPKVCVSGNSLSMIDQ
jgi:hypothetical protein